jgi:hypothetical protein
MKVNNEQDRKLAESQIKQLFEQCKVPQGDADKRLSGILKKGLYELSLRELIEFSFNVFSTMLTLSAAVDKSLKKGSKHE